MQASRTTCNGVNYEQVHLGKYGSHAFQMLPASSDLDWRQPVHVGASTMSPSNWERGIFYLTSPTAMRLNKLQYDFYFSESPRISYKLWGRKCATVCGPCHATKKKILKRVSGPYSVLYTCGMDATWRTGNDARFVKHPPFCSSWTSSLRWRLHHTLVWISFGVISRHPHIMLISNRLYVIPRVAVLFKGLLKFTSLLNNKDVLKILPKRK
jgi:hypothetical protein